MTTPAIIAPILVGVFLLALVGVVFYVAIKSKPDFPLLDEEEE